MKIRSWTRLRTNESCVSFKSDGSLETENDSLTDNLVLLFHRIDAASGPFESGFSLGYLGTIVGQNIRG